MEKIIFIFLSLSLFLTDNETQAQNEQIALISKVQECLILTKKERKKLFTATTELLNLEVSITANCNIIDKYIVGEIGGRTSSMVRENSRRKDNSSKKTQSKIRNEH